MLVLLTFVTVALSQGNSLSGSDNFRVQGGVDKSEESATDADKLSNTFKCSSGHIKETTTFSEEIYDQIYGKISALYNSLPIPCSTESCPRMDLAGCFVRLAAHDFLDYNVTENAFRDDDEKIVGGSDGCIRMQEADNKGLETCTSESQLPAIFNDFCSQVSLPDFLVIASESLMALTATCPKSRIQAFKYNFRYGRIWCGASGYNTGNEDFEIASMNAMGAYGWGDATGTQASIEHQPTKLWQRKVQGSLFYADGGLNTVFPRNQDPEAKKCNKTGEEIGLQYDDMALGTALLGAHGIGRGSKENSGYDGFWSDPYDASVFNNGFYKSLLYKGFEPHQSREETGTVGEDGFEEARFQWIRSDSLKEGDATELMLNTDIVLAHNYEVTAKDSQCCAFFDTDFLVAAGLGADKSQFCSENGTCCQRYTTNCNDLELKKKTLTFATIDGWALPDEDGLVLKNTLPRDQRSVDINHPTATLNGIGRDSVIAFAKDEQLWLEYFHKAWYLATTAGSLKLKRMELSEPVQDDGSWVKTECFSWGCEQMSQGGTRDPADLYFNSHGSQWRMDLWGMCAYKYEEDQCTADEIQTPQKLQALAADPSNNQGSSDDNVATESGVLNLQEIESLQGSSNTMGVAILSFLLL